MDNDVNSSKADKKCMSKDITKEDNHLTEEKIMIQNEKHIDAQEHKLDSYTGGRNVDLSGYLLLRDNKLLTISTSVYGTDNIKDTTLANKIMSEDEIIAWGKEEEEIMRSNEWNLIGGIWQFNEDNRVSTDVSPPIKFHSLLLSIASSSFTQTRKIAHHIYRSV